MPMADDERTKRIADKVRAALQRDREAGREPPVIGKQVAEAEAAEAAHRNEHSETSPLAGVRYDGERGENDLFRLVATATNEKIRAFVVASWNDDERARAATRAALSMVSFYQLMTFAFRNAISALRTGAPQHVDLGFAALTLIDVSRIDPRDARMAIGALTYAAHSLQMDVGATVERAVALAPAEMTNLLRRDVANPLAGLVRGAGLREIDTPDGVAFAQTSYAPYAPTLRLEAAALEAVACFERDVWSVRTVVVATNLPAVWFGTPAPAEVETALASLVGCVNLHAYIRPGIVPTERPQHLIAWMAEAPRDDVAELIAASVPLGKHNESRTGVAAGRLVAIVAANPSIHGVAPYEVERSLDRFKPALHAILAKYASD
jgi:hypothetical protein